MTDASPDPSGDHELLTVAPSVSRRRARSAFRPPLGVASAAFVASVAILLVTWLAIAAYDTTLSVSTNEHLVLHLVEWTLCVATLAVPFFGLRALVGALRSRRLARSGDLAGARTAAEDTRDAMWFVLGLGLTALIIAFAAYLLGANDGALRRVMFDWDYMWRGRTALIRGFWLNVKIFVVAQILVLVWALVVAVVRMLPGRACAPVRWLAITYTDVFRGIPAIIVIYLIVLGFGLADVPGFASMSKDNQIFWLAVLALTLVYGAYVAEVYRAGLESIHWSQTAAARSLGLSQWQTLRYVVIPQAVRRVLPPLLNDAVALQKDTALASIVGVVEVLGTAQLLKNKYFNLSPVFGSAIFFLIITIPFTRLVDWLMSRDKRRTLGGQA